MKPRQVRGGVIQNKSVHRHAPGSPARACEASFVPEESATNREMLDRGAGFPAHRDGAAAARVQYFGTAPLTGKLTGNHDVHDEARVARERPAPAADEQLVTAPVSCRPTTRRRHRLVASPAQVALTSVTGQSAFANGAHQPGFAAERYSDLSLTSPSEVLRHRYNHRRTRARYWS